MSCPHYTVHVIVVAAGTGSRFGTKCPKQFCKLGDRPVLCHTIGNLLKALPDAHIVTVVSHDMADYWRELAAQSSCPAGDIVEGGTSRWESVKNALEYISLMPGTHDCDSVLVHDGARPLIDTSTIIAVLQAIKPGSSAVPVTEVTNSLRRVNADGSSQAVDRSQYRSVVTPQGFMLSDLKTAYDTPYSPDLTDDASVMAAAGMTGTTLIDAPASNIKITNPGDLALAHWYMTH